MFNISAQWRETNTEIFDVTLVKGLHVSPSATKQTIKKEEDRSILTLTTVKYFVDEPIVGKKVVKV